MENELALYSYEDQYVALSNALIRSKEKTDLMESKVEVLSIYRLKEEPKTIIKKDAEGKDYSVHYVDLMTSEIGALQDRSMVSGSIYEKIFQISLALKEKINIIWDKKSKGYKLVSLYDDISYSDGVLHIEFNPTSEHLFLEIADSYSKLSLPILFSFKHNGGFQLYKLLKSYAYNLPPIDLSLSQEELPYYSVSYSLTELRMSLGIVDLTQVDINAEAHKKHPNFSKMEEMEKQPKYKRWGDFENRVLTPGKKEINKQSDIYIKEIATIRSGRGGKVSEVVFYIQHNLAYYRSLEIVPDDSEDEDDKVGLKKYRVIKDTMTRENESVADENKLVDELYNYFAEISLSKTQCLILLRDAEYNLELVYEIYEKAKEQPYIRDLMAWMRAAIKNGGYEDSVSVVFGDAKKGKSLNDVDKSYSETKKDESFKEQVWQGYKERDDFKTFVESVGLPEEMIDALPVEKRMDLFLAYLKSQK